MKKSSRSRTRRSALTVPKANYDQLRARVIELEDTLDAIRTGKVDALVVSRAEGEQVFTLQGAESSYRILVERMNEGALLLSIDGTILYANARFAALAELPLERVIGTPWWMLFQPEEHPQLQALLAASASTPACGDFRLRRTGGHSRPVSVSLSTLHHEGLIGFASVVTDLTERAAAAARLQAANESLESRVEQRTSALLATQASLSESEARHRSLFENQHAIMLIVDPVTGRILDANPAACRFYGWPRERMQQMQISQINALAPEQVQTAIARARETGDYRFLFPHRLADGSIRDVEVLSGPVTAGGREVLFSIVQDVTEREEAEEALRLTQASIDGAAEMVAWFRPDGSVHYVNDATCRTLGYSREELLKMNALDFSPGFTKEQYAEHWREVRQRKSFILQPVHRRKDGTTYPAEVLVNHVVHGGQEFVFAYGRDITERKRAEEFVRQSETRRTLALEAAQAGTWEWDLVTGKNIWSDELWKLYGLQPHSCEPSYEAWRQTVHPEDREPAEQTLRSLVAREADLHLEWRVNDPAGSTRWLMSRGRPERDASGRVTRYLGVVIDISARKQAEDALRESETRLKLAQQAAKIGAFEWNLQTGVNVWTPELEAMYGLAPGEFGKTQPAWEQLVHPEDRTRASSCVKEAFRTGQPVEGQWRVVWRDGSVHWLLGRFQVFTGVSGKEQCLIGVNIDLTELNRAEEELKRRNEELLQFTYAVSHDLKSPVVTLRTFAGYLEQDIRAGDQEGIREDLSYIQRAAEKMAKMLQELLELCRLGRMVNAFEEVAWPVLVKDALQMVAGMVSERGVQVLIQESPLVVCVDRARFVEAFQNLLENAIKFMGAQSAPRIEVGVEPTGSELVFFVRDNGMGIDPRHQHKLFGLFEKLHPKIPGTGLGLAMVKRIVEIHGGRIWAESGGLGQGSTFRFTLPLRQQH